MEVYEVKWKELAKFMTRQLFVILSAGFISLMLVRLVSTGFDMAVTFEHIKLSHVPIAFLIIFAFSLTFAFLISALLKCARVTIENGVITGRNYWLFKRSFEFASIKKVFPFNSNGMLVVIVDAGKKGEIHIHVHIEKSEALFALLENYQNGT